ncbi:MAG TPA: 4-hydroxythreonine-4-phosphate dehydrogenase PdxA [Patescibacteria group bacterium]|nr:4-hydroxythreonine-4-phosphate dehydrogenase PdxA [Patescibacteria group bacterium]
MNEQTIKLALTLGDPGGIGPEIAARLITDGKLAGADICFIGSATALRGALPLSCRNAIPVVPYDTFDPAAGARVFPLLVDTAVGLTPPSGRPSADGGMVAGRAIEIAAAMARAGTVEGMVTGPVSKEALHMAGYHYRGHTEMLADLLDSPDCQMIMVAGELRIVILTRDMPLKDVPAAVTGDRIKVCVRVTDEALRRFWGIEHPKILVAALNPHAGDGGVNGREEIDVIVPALEELIAEGYGVGGPLPADTLFYRWQDKGYDAFVALYHDQGMIPFKLGGFERGVNMTIGLPVIRTSVCHGTAFDIAGHGEPETGSLEEAFTLAVACCVTRRALRANGSPGGAVGERSLNGEMK